MATDGTRIDTDEAKELFGPARAGLVFGLCPVGLTPTAIHVQPLCGCQKRRARRGRTWEKVGWEAGFPTLSGYEVVIWTGFSHFETA